MSRVTYIIPTRALLGLKNAMLSATRGTAVLNTQFKHYAPSIGEFTARENGSLTAFETGQVCFPPHSSTTRPGHQLHEVNVPTTPVLPSALLPIALINKTGQKLHIVQCRNHTQVCRRLSPPCRFRKAVGHRRNLGILCYCHQASRATTRGGGPHVAVDS